jgi:hypothetical protein
MPPINCRVISCCSLTPASHFRLLKRWAIHARLIMTPGLIGKPREPPPVGKPRVPPPGSVIAVPPPGSVIAPPSAAIAMPPVMSDRLHSVATTLINAVDVELCYDSQSPRRLAQEQASGETRCYKKAHSRSSDHFQLLSFDLLGISAGQRFDIFTLITRDTFLLVDSHQCDDTGFRATHRSDAKPRDFGY